METVPHSPLSMEQQMFSNYPEPQQSPDDLLPKKRPVSPVLRGPILVFVAFLIESVRFIRELVWRDAGFDALRNIQGLLECYEARYDPAVIPIPQDSTFNQPEPSSRPPTPPPSHHNFSKPLPQSQYYSVADYHKLYLSGQATPTDVAKALLPLIRRDVSPSGNHASAWLSTRVDLVLKAAEESTIRYREGRSLGVLDGVPAGVKDDFDLDGYTMTMGSLRNYSGKSVKSGSVTNYSIRKLEEAGVVILGKLTMHEFGMDTTGCNPHHGTPLNPFNPAYYPGGSSSGPGYAVGAGLVPIALGGDAGGSIRIPAAYCSIFGLKPTHARLSSYPTPNCAPTCCVQGPMASDMYSLAAVYKVIAEPHPSSRFPPLCRQPSKPLTKLLGIDDKWFSCARLGVQSVVKDMVGKLCSEYGYSVVSINIPFTLEGQAAHAMTVLTDAASLLPDTSKVSAANKILLALGRTTPARDYLLAQKLRQLLMQHLSHLWRAHPGMLIITPTAACAGSPIRGGSAELQHGLLDGNMTLESMTYVWLANLCGLPSISVPAGFVIPEGQDRAGEVADENTEGKIPIGLMATGEWCSEDALLEFGAEAEAARRDQRCRPPIWEDIISRAKTVSRESEAGVHG
ncbi:amidase signature domain-containing protein [Thelonectria olida]|uniref:Amidase signature domain-containing protein n=1 Tax=Thelonectria olida TaxID=1576542 RepID=A0A9P8WH93_9HYPO|nr:amidase signature domain-containing protein [Thelonectria olida]